MNCPSCNSPNPPENIFCMQCGQPLHNTSPNQSQTSANSWLGIQTVRVLISLFGLWVIKAVLTRLSFIRELRIPDFNLPPVTVVEIIIFILAVILLLAFARQLGVLWPRAYPAYAQIAPALNALIYALVLSFLYKILKPLVVGFMEDSEALLVLQLLFTFIALIILLRAAMLVYQKLPAWIDQWRKDFLIPKAEEK